VEARWSSGAIEQHGDARSATAHVNDDTTPVGNLWASSGTKLAHPETHTDSNSVDVLVIHYRYPVSKIDRQKKQKLKISLKLISESSSMQPADENCAANARKQARPGGSPPPAGPRTPLIQNTFDVRFSGQRTQFR